MVSSIPEIVAPRGIERGLVWTVGFSAVAHAVGIIAALVLPAYFLTVPPRIESYTVDLVAPDVVGGFNTRPGGGSPPPAEKAVAGTGARIPAPAPVAIPPASNVSPPAPQQPKAVAPLEPPAAAARPVPPQPPPEPAAVKVAPKAPVAPPRKEAVPEPAKKPAPVEKSQAMPAAKAAPIEKLPLPKPAPAAAKAVAKPVPPAPPPAAAKVPPKPASKPAPPAVAKAVPAAKPAPAEKAAAPVPPLDAESKLAAERNKAIAAAVQRRAAAPGAPAETSNAIDQRIAAAVQRRATAVGAGSGQAAPSSGGPVSSGPGVGAGGKQADLQYVLYHGRMLERIKKAWAWAGADPSLRVVLRFNINPDGAIRNVRTIEPSGDASYDASAERAVHAASPLDPVPERLHEDFAVIELMFQPSDLEP